MHDPFEVVAFMAAVGVVAGCVLILLELAMGWWERRKQARGEARR